MSPIARLRGKVLERGPDWLIVDVGGVGFMAHCPASTISAASTGSEIALHTHLAVREDGMTLYGFTQQSEQRLFLTLLTVGGVGPKAALALLSIMSADELAYAIASDNTAALAKAPGVGKKLASRISLELRDKLAEAPAQPLPQTASDVVTALLVLGYSQVEALEAVAGSGADPAWPVEQRVRSALAYFGKRGDS